MLSHEKFERRKRFIAKMRLILASLVGRTYQELPGDLVFEPGLRKAIKESLLEINAEKYFESGTPAFEVNNEYFRIGRFKLRILTEDEMFVSIWGPKALVTDFYNRIKQKLELTKLEN